MLNDGVVFAVGEHWVGAGRGARDMVGLVVSTGVGGGLVLDGTVMDGPSGNAGHLGHMVVDPDGPACGCGGRGCVESVASGPSVVTWARSQGWAPPAGATDSARTLVEMAASGDPLSRAALSRSGRAVGVALASIAHLLDVTTFVVGGGLSHAGDLLFDPMRSAAKEHARLAFAADLQIVPSGLGVDAALIGAAAAILRPDYWGPG
jgi:glucokinase